MRFEVIAAFVIGALLPVLETVRRGIGHWAINFTTMFEDYVGGALLLNRRVGCLSRKEVGRGFPCAGVGINHWTDDQ